MRVRWTSEARDNLRQIGRYIARDNPVAARQFVHRLRQRVRNGAAMPWSGRKVPELDRDDVREWIEGNYRIVYRLSGSTLAILSVFEGHCLHKIEGLDVPAE